MPLVTEDITHASPYLTPPEQKPARTPSWGETFSSAFNLENDVVNAIELMNRPHFKPDPTFNLGKRLKEENLWDFERDEYIGARSEDEFKFLMQKRQAEKRDRDTLTRAGWGGVLAAMTAGLISPTMFIPVLGPAARAGRVGKAMMEGAGLMALAAGAQEGILFEAQETRGAGESALGITSGAVLGAILGGAAAFLKNVEFEKMASDMVNPRGEPTISRLPMNGDRNTGVGAEEVIKTDAGGLKAGPANWLSGIGPVTRGIRQTTSPLVRWMTSQFSDAGIRREGHAAGDIAAEGGTIENNIKTYFRHIQDHKTTVDDLYNDYIFNGNPPSFGANARGFIAGLRSPDKMSKMQFREEITRATWANDEHAVPQVAKAAKWIRDNIYNPIFEEAKQVGIYGEAKELEEVLGDASYGMRMYDNDYLSAHFNRFVEIVARHVQRKLETQFQERLEKVAGQTKRDEELLEDITRPAEEIAQLRAQFQQELEETSSQVPAHVQAIQDDIDTLRAQKRNIPKDSIHEGADQARSMIDVEIADLKKRGGEALTMPIERQREIKRRLRNLNKSLVTLTDKHQKKLAKIERIEELQLNTLNRAVRSAQKFLAGLSSLTDKEFAKATSEVRERFGQAVSDMERAEARRSKIAQSDRDPDGDQLWAQDSVVERRNARVLELYKRIDELESFDRPAWRAAIQDGLNEMLATANDINSRRAVRAARLEEAAKALDPAIFGKKLDEIKARIKERKLAFTDDMRVRGADDIDLAAKTADFGRYSKETAQAIAHKILGSERRIAVNDIIQGDRGPELARMLDIPSSEIAEFLHRDSEIVTRTYIRTLAADISIARKFGTSNAAEYFGIPGKQSGLLTDELTKALERIEQAKDKKGNPLSEEKKAKLSQQVNKFYAEARHDLHVLLERSRGIRGVPKDPRGWAARGASTLMHLNVLRYMGGVLLASVSDPARVVQKYGMNRVLKQSMNALTGGLKQVRMSQREAQLAGTALDVVLHSRANALYDIFDPIRHGTKVEKGLEWTTSKIGLIALFDPWTAAWKEFTAGLENMTVLEAISKHMEGRATKKDIEELAARNIDEETARIIWEQVNGNGGGKVNGVWLPETEAWDVSRPEVAKALRTYRSALVGTVDDTIVTPGFERPNWIDSGIAGRMLGQFRSFGLSSTTKVLMSGMQQRDMAYMNGTIISLALGAVSYYLWAVATGGEAQEEMMNAGWDKWADEAITRSGQTAVLDEVMRVAQRVPGLSPYVSFSGTRSTRREGGDLTEAILGPSFDALEKMNTVIMGADDPTQHTLHTLRQLLPFQNLFFLRQAWDAMEAAIDLPEKRESRK